MKTKFYLTAIAVLFLSLSVSHAQKGAGKKFVGLKISSNYLNSLKSSKLDHFSISSNTLSVNKGYKAVFDSKSGNYYVINNDLKLSDVTTNDGNDSKDLGNGIKFVCSGSDCGNGCKVTAVSTGPRSPRILTCTGCSQNQTSTRCIKTVIIPKESITDHLEENRPPENGWTPSY